jgi:hypothetical protein
VALRSRLDVDHDLAKLQQLVRGSRREILVAVPTYEYVVLDSDAPLAEKIRTRLHRRHVARLQDVTTPRAEERLFRQADPNTVTERVIEVIAVTGGSYPRSGYLVDNCSGNAGTHSRNGIELCTSDDRVELSLPV